MQAGRPLSHVAAEAGISRRALAKWYARFLADGEDGLLDRSSRPVSSPNRTDEAIEDLVEALRRQTKHGPARLSADLKRLHGVQLAPSTVHRILVRRGISRLRDLDPPTGLQLREVIRYEHEHPGDLVHVDVKKLGRIPDGGGWRMHGRDSEQARASKRTGPGTGRVGYTYLHSAIDDHSRLAYTEALEDEKGATAAAFWHRAVAFFAEHGIARIERVLTDNGSCYRSKIWTEAVKATGTRHKRTRPYTPRTNGKVERFNGTLAREWAYVRAYTSEGERRGALADFINYYNHDRPHAALGGRPPVSRTAGGEHRIVFERIPEPLEDDPQQLELDLDSV